VWTWQGPIDSVTLELSIDSGQTWLPMGAAIPNTGSLTGTIPELPSLTCFVRIADAADGVPADTSDCFVIAERPNTAPQFPLSIDTISLNEGDSLAWVARATDAEGDPIAFAFFPVPAWASVVDDTVLVMEPGSGDSSVMVGVLAIDDRGAADTLVLVVLVDHPVGSTARRTVLDGPFVLRVAGLGRVLSVDFRDVQCVVIRDLAGRTVRRLVPGNNEVAWDRMSASGTTVGHGSFVLELVTREAVLRRQIVLGR
jgi:hypothetical protein